MYRSDPLGNLIVLNSRAVRVGVVVYFARAETCTTCCCGRSVIRFNVCVDLRLENDWKEGYYLFKYIHTYCDKLLLPFAIT